jgi:hypothetical protein
MPNNAPDLTRNPPRSPRVRLGGYVILPRMLDKGRAVIAGTAGEYKYACPLDQRFLHFAGIDAESLKEQLAEGRADGEILEWISAQSSTQPSPVDIEAWSAQQEQRVPTDPESRKFFNDIHAQIAPDRVDIATWFDLLDLDDYVSYGNKP